MLIVIFKLEINETLALNMFNVVPLYSVIKHNIIRHQNRILLNINREQKDTNHILHRIYSKGRNVRRLAHPYTFKIV